MSNSVRLGDIFTVSSGGTPNKKEASFYESGTIPWVKTGDLKEKYIPEGIECITEAGLNNSSAKLFPKDTVLIAMYGATIGACSILSYEAATNQACAAFMPHNDVLPEYLFYFLSSKKEQFVKDGVGGAQPNISAGYLKNVKFDLKPLAKQKEVISSLNLLDDLISLRKQQLAKLDELVKARFVEMFGDPEINPNNWEIIKIGKVIESCEAGWSGNGTQRQKISGEIAVLKVSAVTKGFFVPEECKVLDNQSDIKKYVFPQKGDLLFSRANTREMVGATAVISQDYPELILPDKLWKIRFASCANVLYMKHILSHQSIRAKFSEASTGTSGSMFNVSMGKFKGIEIPLPPTEIQEQFAAFVEQVDKSKLAVQQSLVKLELLKKALMQKYFG